MSIGVNTPAMNPPLTISERVRLREAEREPRELRQKVTFLEKVAAYFASEPR
jgi:transposase